MLASRVLKILEHKKNLAAVFILFNSSNMDHRRLYGPQDFRTEIAKHMQTSTAKDDNADLLTALEDKLGNDTDSDSDYVSSKDISKTLKALEKEIGLINIRGKDEIKKAKGKQRIQLLGKPSLYKLPYNSEVLKRVMSNPKAVELIFKSLVNMNLLPHLEFLWEASFHALREQVRTENTYELGKLAEKSIAHLNLKIDQQGWESYRTFLLSIPEDRLGVLSHRLFEVSANHPELYRFILLLGLSISP